MKRRTLLAASTAIALLAQAGIAAADVIKIGVLAPVSGAQAADGQEMVTARSWPWMS